MSETNPEDMTQPEQGHEPVLDEVQVRYELDGDQAAHAHEPNIRERIARGLGHFNLAAKLDDVIDSKTFPVAETTAALRQRTELAHHHVDATQGRRDARRERALSLLSPPKK